MTEYYGVIEAKAGVSKIYCCIRESYAYSIKRNANLTLEDLRYQSVYDASRQLADFIIQIDFELPPINIMFLTDTTNIPYPGVSIFGCRILKSRLKYKISENWICYPKNNDKNVQLALELTLSNNKVKIIII